MMFFHQDPQEVSFQQREPQKLERREKLLKCLVLIMQQHSKLLSLLARLLWGLMMISPLLICALIFLNIMFSIYTREIVTLLPADEWTLYIGALGTVGIIALASIVIGLLSVFKVKFKLIFYGIGVVLFIFLMVVYESFIFSSISIVPHLEITQTGFSSAQMSILSGSVVRISNASSDSVPQTLCISSSTNNRGIPDRLLCPGLTLQRGQSVDVHFNNTGTFILSSSTIPGLTFAITVSINSDSASDEISD